MIKFIENPTKIGKLTSDGILPINEKIKIRLALKDRTKKLVLTLTNIFYFLHSLSNLVKLELLNNIKIYYHNKNQILYDLKI